MKSGKQRRLEIKARRLEIKARRLERAKKQAGMNVYSSLHPLPEYAIAVDHSQLAPNNSYGTLPLFYIDRPFFCKDCGSEEVWTAKQQKWWYEIAKGDVNSTAVRCRACRKQERERKAEARRVHLDGIARKLAEKSDQSKS